MPPGRFALLRRALTGRLISALLQLFNGLGSWHKPDAARFAARAVPMVEGAQTVLANLTSTYVASVASDALQQPVAPPPIPRTARLRLRQVDPQEVYQRPFTEAYTALADGKTLDEALGRARVRLREVAEGDMQQVYSESSRAAMQGLREDQRPTGWRRVPVGQFTCAFCLVAATQRYRIEELNPIHPGCVPAGTKVRAYGVLGATRRRYSGELTVVTTATGDQISVTPNHPILTDRGWIPASRVRPRDYVLNSSGAQWMTGGGPYESHRPALAEDVWRSLAMTFGFVQVPLSAEDFHGDGSEGEVDVVRTDGYFAAVGNAQAVQTCGERQLVPAEVGRVEFSLTSVSAPLIPGRLPSRRSRMSGSGLRSSLLGGHLCGAHATGVRAATAGNVGILEPSGHDVARDTPSVSDDVFSETVFDVVGSQFASRVSNISRVDFAGHVINFQTRSGRYEAYNHIIHNCDCVVEPILGPVEDRIIEPELLERVHAAVKELTGVEDRGARAVDYRKLLVDMTKDHGELGPMLVHPRHDFQGPIRGG